jgi:dTDP-4-dehydrorhamnose 3,5-epimerase
MKFNPARIEGVMMIEPDLLQDDRGFFARIWCREEFEKQGLKIEWQQVSISYNRKKGTLRGMHFQNAPFSEVKLVHCVTGSIYDVVLDLRKDSPTYRQWMSVELNRENRKMILIPPGCAHGFQTLTDHAEVYYHISPLHVAEASSGVRWNDTAFGIRWPFACERIVSDRDQNWPDFDDKGRSYVGISSLAETREAK